MARKIRYCPIEKRFEFYGYSMKFEPISLSKEFKKLNESGVIYNNVLYIRNKETGEIEMHEDFKYKSDREIIDNLYEEFMRIVKRLDVEGKPTKKDMMCMLHSALVHSTFYKGSNKVLSPDEYHREYIISHENLRYNVKKKVDKNHWYRKMPGSIKGLIIQMLIEKGKIKSKSEIVTRREKDIRDKMFQSMIEEYGNRGNFSEARLTTGNTQEYFQNFLDWLDGKSNIYSDNIKR